MPAERFSVDFELEYGKATIEVHKDAIEKDQKILVIDDLLATGGTAEAAGKLVKMCGGKVAGFLFVINLFDLPGEKKLLDNSYLVKSLIRFLGIKSLFFSMFQVSVRYLSQSLYDNQMASPLFFLCSQKFFEFRLLEKLKFYNLVILLLYPKNIQRV